MDKKTLTYLTGFTLIFTVILVIYIFISVFIKPDLTTQKPSRRPTASGLDKEVFFPKRTPAMTFSPSEPNSARVFFTPIPNQPTPNYQARAPKQFIVAITSSAFVPDNVEIKPGDVLKWTNDDTQPHRLIGKTWKSGVIKPGRDFTQQFDLVGTFQYYTEANPDMIGSITVVK